MKNGFLEDWFNCSLLQGCGVGFKCSDSDPRLYLVLRTTYVRLNVLADV